DTCAQHGGPHVYLCLFQPAHPSWLAWTLAALFMARAAHAAIVLVRGLRLTRRLAGSLRGIASRMKDGAFIIPGRASFTAGWPRSDVFLGEELLASFDDFRLAVVCA